MKPGLRVPLERFTAAATAAMVLAAPCHAAGQGGQVVAWGANNYGQTNIPLPVLSPVKAVACGGSFVSVLMEDGTVATWGWWDSSYYGATNRPAGLYGIVQISAGDYHTIGLRSDGTAVAWGRNHYGQCLGTDANGDPINTPEPIGQRVMIDGELLTGALQVEAGNGFSVAIDGAQRVVAWGINYDGEANVPPKLTAKRVSAGSRHSLAVRLDGTVVGWGSNYSGECLGSDGAGSPITGTPAGQPTRIRGAVLTGVTDVAGGSDWSLALRSDGTVVAWGRPLPGQPDQNMLAGVHSIFAGPASAFALRHDGTYLAWGTSFPPGLTDVRQFAAGDYFSVALDRRGKLIPSGYYEDGNAPATTLGIVSIASGDHHSYAARADGTLVGWGQSTEGQLQHPPGLADVVQVACGLYHSYGVKRDGSVVGWGARGHNFYGQLDTPAGLPEISQVSCGLYHTLALTRTGTVWGWGGGSNYNYGQGSVPPALPAVQQISAGHLHSLAVLAGDRHVRAWGAGTSVGEWPHYGQSLVPASVGSVLRAAGGARHSLAIRSGGDVVGWGNNGDGESLGTDRFGEPLRGPALGQPVRVRGVVLTDAVDVAAAHHSLALLADGTVVAWGSNFGGALNVPEGLSGVTQITAASGYSAALIAPELSVCANSLGGGGAAVRQSGSDWQHIGAWEWADGGPQVPGAGTDVVIGTRFGSVGTFTPASIGSLCDAQCRTLSVPAASTLIVPVDLTQPLAAQDHSIDVGLQATLKGRLWLLASGASVLPADFELPVVSAGTFDGYFSTIEATVPALPGHFLTLVPGAGPGAWKLKVLPLPSNAASGVTGVPGQADAGAQVVAAETIDLDGNGYDDLALLLDFGAGIPGTLQVLLNDGAGNLGTASRRQQTAPQPRTLAVSRIDGDDRDDVAVGLGAAATVRSYLNNGSATGAPFDATAVEFATGSPATALTVLPWPSPLVVAGTGAAQVLFFVPGNPAPAQQVSAPSVPSTLGKRGRIVVSGGANPNSFGSVATNGWFAVLAAGGTGQYAVTQSIPVPGQPVSVDVADIDRDGHEDVLTANAQPQQLGAGTSLGVLTLFKGTPTGFESPVPIAPLSNDPEVRAATAGLDAAMVDVDDDGVRDIVTVHQTLVGQSAAAVVPVAQQAPGGPLTLDGAQAIVADAPLVHPVLCPRGDVLGPGNEGVFIVDTGANSLTGGDALLGGTAPTGTPYRAEPLPCLGDLDGDGRVSGIDFGVLLGEWGGTGGGTGADLDGNGIVSGVDLGLLIGAWGDCPG